MCWPSFRGVPYPAELRLPSGLSGRAVLLHDVFLASRAFTAAVCLQLGSLWAGVTTPAAAVAAPRGVGLMSPASAAGASVDEAYSSVAMDDLSVRYVPVCLFCFVALSLDSNKS
jgi:hypothetical protein